MDVTLPWQPLAASDLAGTFVLTRIGGKTQERTLPAIVIPLGMFTTTLLADTLVLDGSGAGTDIGVPRSTNVLTGQYDSVSVRTAVTYQTTGRLALIARLPCY